MFRPFQAKLTLTISLTLIATLTLPARGQSLLGANIPTKSTNAKKRSKGVKPPAAVPNSYSEKTASTLLPGEQQIIKAIRSTSGAPGDSAVDHPSPASAPRHGLLNPIAWQAALDRAGFSPGVIDGSFGPKTAAALRAFQESRGLPQTGLPDQATAETLNVDNSSGLMRYEIEMSDLSAIRPPPKKWQDKAKVDFLGYDSMLCLAAERGHCTKWLVSRLNSGVEIDRLRAGDSIILPDVRNPEAAGKAKSVEVDFATKTIRAAEANGKTIALLHCSIAREFRDRPSGPCKVAEIVENPKYLFDPKKWPEVRGVTQKLLIPSGPRNPVGLCWIGLTIDGYGIHGTPEPELIGKTGSHGCFRLANWDALRLAKTVAVGMEVRLIDSAAKLVKRPTKAKASLATFQR